MVISFIGHYILCVPRSMMDFTELCTDIVLAEDLDLFKTNSRIICAGSSNSGKSYLINSLILENESKFNKIIITGQPHDILKKSKILETKIVTYDYFPSIQEINEFGEKGHKLVLLDDTYVTAFSDKNVLSYYTHARHSNISCILISQNLFYTRGKFSKDITLNCSHLILLRMRDISQLSHLSRQIYGKGYSSKIPDVYKFIVKHYRYPHLLIDVSGTIDEKLELRSNIIHNSENNFQTVYAYI